MPPKGGAGVPSEAPTSASGSEGFTPPERLGQGPTGASARKLFPNPPKIFYLGLALASPFPFAATLNHAMRTRQVQKHHKVHKRWKGENTWLTTTGT